MGTSRDLGDDAAVGLMRLRLADDGLRQDSPLAGDKRRRTVVARRFEAEDHSHFAPGPLPDPPELH